MTSPTGPTNPNQRRGFHPIRGARAIGKAVGGAAMAGGGAFNRQIGRSWEATKGAGRFTREKLVQGKDWTVRMGGIALDFTIMSPTMARAAATAWLPSTNVNKIIADSTGDKSKLHDLAVRATRAEAQAARDRARAATLTGDVRQKLLARAAKYDRVSSKSEEAAEKEADKIAVRVGVVGAMTRGQTANEAIDRFEAEIGRGPSAPVSGPPAP